MTPTLATNLIGDGTPELAFCHGLLGRGRNLMSIAKGLAPRTSLMIDLPNHGRSGWTTTFDYLAMADAVAATIADTCEGPVTLIGHSMGGKVAMLAALRHRDVVGRLCVIDIAPRAGGLGGIFAELISALRTLDLTSVATRADADAHLAAKIPQPTLRAFLLQNLQRDGSSWRWEPNLELLAANLDAIGSWPDPQAPPFTGPATWLRGESSDYVSDADLPAMRALFPRTRLQTIAGAGHWVHADAPQAVIGAIEDLLGEPLTLP